MGLPSAVCLAVFAGVLAAHATASAGVMEITNEPFFESVTNSSQEKVAIYLWYSPGNAVSNQLLLRNGAYNELGRLVMADKERLRGKVLVCKMKVDDYDRLAKQHGVRTLPTIHLFGYNRDRKNPEVFKGNPQDPEELLTWVEKAVYKMEVDIAANQEDDL